MTPPSPAPHFDDFTEASEIHEYNAWLFADQVRSYTPTQRLRTLNTAGSDQRLHRPSDAHQRLLDQRRSDREFSSAPASQEQLGSLLSGFSATVAHVTDMDRHIAVYHPDSHALGWIADLPPWETWQTTLGSGLETEPPITVFFCLDTKPMTEKYGERGGRFALIEVGHGAQVLAERAIAAGLSGYSIGGVLERSAQRLFGFDRLETPPTPVLAYACGLQASAPEKSDPNEIGGSRLAALRQRFRIANANSNSNSDSKR
jgi:hypothetical protein